MHGWALFKIIIMLNQKKTIFIENFYPRVIEVIMMVMVIVYVIIELIIINIMKILHIRHKMLATLAGHCCSKVTNMHH